jgi:DNA repair protein RecO
MIKELLFFYYNLAVELYLVEAIVLKSTQFHDQGRGITFFTQEQGLLRVNSKKGRTQTISPLTLTEIHLQRGRGEYYSLADISLLDPLLEIRENLERLQASARMAQLLLALQFPEKPSPLLFSLFKIYLLRMKEFPHPALLGASFCLKLLKHEGIFPRVKEELCLSLSDEEWQICLCLAHSRSFTILQDLPCPRDLIDRLHKHAFKLS